MPHLTREKVYSHWYVTILDALSNHRIFASAIDLYELVIHLRHLGLGLSDESHALDVAVAHFLKRARTPILLLPPGKLCENGTARSSSLLGLCDIDTHAK